QGNIELHAYLQDRFLCSKDTSLNRGLLSTLSVAGLHRAFLARTLLFDEQTQDVPGHAADQLDEQPVEFVKRRAAPLVEQFDDAELLPATCDRHGQDGARAEI